MKIFHWKTGKMKNVSNDLAEMLIRQHPILKQFCIQDEITVQHLANILVNLKPTMIRYYQLEIFGTRYADDNSKLDPKLSNHVEQQARRQFKIENAVLQSKEALQVRISYQMLLTSYLDILKHFQTELGQFNLEQFKQSLVNSQLDETQFGLAVLHQLCVEQVMDYVAEQNMPISSQDALHYYQTHQSKFIQPEYRVVRHILITINETLLDNQYKHALERAKRISQYLIEYPEQFAQQAQKYSECPTALEGGVLGKVIRGILYPELDEILFKMQKGQISVPIETAIGLHILYCEDIINEKKIAFNEVEQNLIAQLGSQARKLRQKKWLHQLVNSHNAEYVVTTVQ